MALDTDPVPAVSPAELRVTVERHHGWTVLHVYGELDLATVPVLADQLEAATRDAAQRAVEPAVALELTGLVLCDSSGLSLLVRGRRQIVTVCGGRLLVLNPRRPLRETLARTGLDRHLAIAMELPG